MLNNFIFAKQKSLFEEKLNNGEVLDEAIVFIEDTKEIWNHGTYFGGLIVYDLSSIILNEDGDLILNGNITQEQYNEISKADVVTTDGTFFAFIHSRNDQVYAFRSTVIQDELQSVMEIAFYPDLTFSIFSEDTTSLLIGNNFYWDPRDTSCTWRGVFESEQDFRDQVNSNILQVCSGLLVHYVPYVNTDDDNPAEMIYIGSMSFEDTIKTYKFVFNQENYTWEVSEFDLIKSIEPFYTEITYSELKTLVDNGGLIPGKQYAITDYSCIYIQPISLLEREEPADDIKAIICTAISNNKLSENVEVLREEGYVPIIECKYDINPENCSWTKGMTTKSPKGVIWYMKDINGNSCMYDFKHIKFRRWAIKDITANMEEDTGSGGSAGPYRINVTDTCYVWSDNRARIGSGEENDVAMIPAIFNGTWAACTTDLQTVPVVQADISAGFHADYALQCHKHYKDTTYPYDKYLSWMPDMRSANGLNAPINQGTCVTYNNQIVNVDSSCIDRYTFDFEGQDASERTLYGSTQPLVRDAVLGGYGEGKDVQQALSNTVITISRKAIDNVNTRIQGFRVKALSHNTILLRPYGTYTYAYIDNVDSESTFNNNLVITIMLRDTKFVGQTRYNYFCCDMFNCNFDGQVYYNTIFGYIQDIDARQIKSNLWYNAFMQIKLGGATSWRSPYDGMYSYNVEMHGFCNSNILAPMQYFNIRPHFNTNTLRRCYNKGSEIESANQGNSYGWIGQTRINYGIGQGLKLGNLYRSEICTTCFQNRTTQTSTGVERFNNTQPAIPSLYFTYVSGRYSSTTGIDSLTDDEKALISSTMTTKPRATLYHDYANNKWRVIPEHGIGKVDSDGNITKIMKVTALPDSPDANVLYVVTG